MPKATAKTKPTAKKPVAKKPIAKKPARKVAAKLKTVPTGQSVAAFIDGLGAPRSAECKAIATMMRKATGAAPKMWGSAIVGFGDMHYKYASGREGDFFLVGFSPRKAALTVYINGGFENHGDLLAKLGAPKVGMGCLYLKSLDGIDRTVLATLIDRGVAELRARSLG
jgi:Domain of unknown function (DU1801)